MDFLAQFLESSPLTHGLGSYVRAVRRRSVLGVPVIADSSPKDFRATMPLCVHEATSSGLEDRNWLDREVPCLGSELARESTSHCSTKDNVCPIPDRAYVVDLSFHRPSGANAGYVCGGWNPHEWQGVSGNAIFLMALWQQGFEKIATVSVNTTLKRPHADVSYTAADMAAAKSAQRECRVHSCGCDWRINYAETPGVHDPALGPGHIASVHAVINAFLPCEQGGQAIAEIIYGKVNPSGRMPITYPKDAANIMIPYNHRVSTQCASGYCQMEWDFGTGLSYTTFTYSSVKLSKTTVTGKSDSITASVTVTNSGKMAGKETVMLFVIQPYRSISVPEVKQLKKFKKISLEAGASTTVEFKLTAADWSVYDPQIGNGFVQVAEDGDFVVAIKPETECNVYGEITNPLCAKFELKTGVEPFNLEESLKARY
ncbi:Lysosomal beta glucosidase, partial [Globisporangium splendens]